MNLFDTSLFWKQAAFVEQAFITTHATDSYISTGVPDHRAANSLLGIIKVQAQRRLMP